MEAAAPAHGVRGWDWPQAPDPGPQSPPGAAGAEPSHQPRGWPQPRVLARRRAGIPWVPCWGNQLCHQTLSPAKRTHTLAMGWHGTARHGTPVLCPTGGSGHKLQPQQTTAGALGTLQEATVGPELQPCPRDTPTPAPWPTGSVTSTGTGTQQRCLGCAGDEQKVAREVVPGGQHPKGGSGAKAELGAQGEQSSPQPHAWREGSRRWWKAAGHQTSQWDTTRLHSRTPPAPRPRTLGCAGPGGSGEQGGCSRGGPGPKRGPRHQPLGCAGQGHASAARSHRVCAGSCRGPGFVRRE